MNDLTKTLSLAFPVGPKRSSRASMVFRGIPCVLFLCLGRVGKVRISSDLHQICKTDLNPF